MNAICRRTLLTLFLSLAAALAGAEESSAGRSVKVTIDYGDGVQKVFLALPWREKMTVLTALQEAEKHPRGIKVTHQGSGERVLVTAIDGVVGDDEQARLKALLKQRFALGEDDLDDLMSAAEAADREAVDLYGFTSVLKQRLDIGERERLVGQMWELVYADGKVHEFEDNLIWRAAELLGVSSEVRIRLKQAARDHGGA